MPSDYTKDLNRYKYVTRRVHERWVDQFKRTSKEDRTTIRVLQERIHDLEAFIRVGPHAAAWAAWQASKEQ